MSDSSLSFAVVSNGVCCLYDGNSFQVHVGETMLSWEFSVERLIRVLLCQRLAADERADCRIALRNRLLLLHCWPQSVLAFSKAPVWPGLSFYRVWRKTSTASMSASTFSGAILESSVGNAPAAVSWSPVTKDPASSATPSERISVVLSPSRPASRRRRSFSCTPKADSSLNISL